MWFVRVNNGVVGTPYRMIAAQNVEDLVSRGVYPCNYGDYNPALNYIAGMALVGDEVVYDLQPLTADMQLYRLRTEKIPEIVQAFELALAAGHVCSNGIKMDAPVDKILTLQAGFDLANRLEQPTMYIVDYDNVLHAAVPVATVNAMLTELGQNFAVLHEKKNTLRTQILAATTLEEVSAITW